MNHAEISRQLALAIGYPLECIRDLGVCACVYRDGGPYGGGEGWYTFNYRSPDVALPVLEWLMRKYDIQAIQYGSIVHLWISGRGTIARADTLPLAIALAAIEVSK